MGLSYTTLQLRNPRLPQIQAMQVPSLADTGSMYLCIPFDVARRLQLEELDKREIVTAENKRILCSYVGPIEVSFANRSCFTGAIVLGNEVLLGAIPMEDMDLVVLPLQRMVAVNPLSPNIASGIVK